MANTSTLSVDLCLCMRIVIKNLFRSKNVQEFGMTKRISTNGQRILISDKKVN